MQHDKRTAFNQPNRSKPAQASRTASGQSRTASPQANRTTANQAGGVGSPLGNPRAKKAAMKNQPKDRLGQAVVSMIFGIFGILFFIVAMIKMSFDSQYSYTTSPGTMITFLFAFILNIVGFILGIRARRSTKGRGMAIAGITLTTFPLIVMIIFIGGTLVLYYMWW
ncbi:DUF4190 domain-containing protein [Paenibacillus solani]|uniref:DUF4190 domain-containing protein n=1 Tax=Paenibacillus solani TaxID=1705565 RepID=UPI003D27508F